MIRPKWPAVPVLESHVVLPSFELLEIYEALENDPNEAVKPAARPTGLTYVDDNGFDMRIGTKLLLRRSKSSGNGAAAADTNGMPPSEDRDEDFPVNHASERTKVVVEREAKADGNQQNGLKPLPRGWKVETITQEQGVKKGRTYKVYIGGGKRFYSYVTAEKYWKEIGVVPVSGTSSGQLKDGGLAGQKRGRDEEPYTSLEEMLSWLRAAAIGAQTTQYEDTEHIKDRLLYARKVVCMTGKVGRTVAGA